jgi:hypothetical protein
MIYLGIYKMDYLTRHCSTSPIPMHLLFFPEGHPNTPSWQISQLHSGGKNTSTRCSIHSFLQSQKNFRPLLVLRWVELSSLIGTSLHTCQLSMPSTQIVAAYAFVTLRPPSPGWFCGDNGFRLITLPTPLAFSRSFTLS